MIAPRRRSLTRRVVRAWRLELSRWDRVRRDRLRQGHEHASAQERALLGALLQDPAMIEVVAASHPPGWFTDPRCLRAMAALVCLRQAPSLSVDDLVQALDRHAVLEAVGGRQWVETIVRPGPFLEEARAEVALARARLAPVADHALVKLARGLLESPPDTARERRTPARGRGALRRSTPRRPRRG